MTIVLVVLVLLVAAVVVGFALRRRSPGPGRTSSDAALAPGGAPAGDAPATGQPSATDEEIRKIEQMLKIPAVKRFGQEQLFNLNRPEAVPLLMWMVNDMDTQVVLQARAVRALGECGDRSVAPFLLAILENRSAVLQENAAIALRKVGDSNCWSGLLAKLEGGERSKLRFGCAITLAQLGWKPATPEEAAKVMTPIVEFTLLQGSMVECYILDAIGTMGRLCVELLERAKEDPGRSQEERETLANALAKVKPPAG